MKNSVLHTVYFDNMKVIPVVFLALVFILTVSLSCTQNVGNKNLNQKINQSKIIFNPALLKNKNTIFNLKESEI